MEEQIKFELRGLPLILFQQVCSYKTFLWLHQPLKFIKIKYIKELKKNVYILVF